MDKIKELLDTVEPSLTKDQISIIDECMTKPRFGLSIHMGSGKTIISLFLALKKKYIQNNHEPFLVICSKTIIPSWEIEIKKFFGKSLKYQIMNVNSRNFSLNPDTIIVLTTPETNAKFYKENAIEEKFVKKEQYFDGLVPFPRTKNVYDTPVVPYLKTSYGGAILFQKKWSCLIVDEAHKYTKISTGRCQAIASICSGNRWVLSGTLFDEPDIEKILGYYVILHWPGFPKDLPEASVHLRSMNYKGTNETIVSRKKIELPDVKITKKIIEHNLSPEEASIYVSMKGTLRILKEHIKKLGYLDKREKKKFSSYILAMLTFLRQSVVVPILPIANITLDMSEMKEARSDLSVILMNQFNKLNLQDFLNDENSVKSSRIKKVLETVHHHNKPSDKIVVFSCFRTSLDVLEFFVNEEVPIDIFTLDSSMSITKRGELLDEFEKNPANSILFTTFNLGAEGLNLQCANVVIILDFWWNSSTTQQAIARVIRNGQKAQEVFVYFFTSNTGIEKSLFAKQQDKIILLNELKIGPMKSIVKTLKIDEILKLIDRNENITFLKNLY